MYLHVLALDLDGTIAEKDKVARETWSALQEAYSVGISLILVTGRRLSALAEIGPFEKLCKAIVAENGAVVYLPDSKIILLPFGSLPDKLLSQLLRLEIPLEMGEAIAATWVPHDMKILKVLSESGYPATIEYNKGAVMLLPQGATKGTGLLVALQELGYSAHNVIACGDGENDRSFFEQAEVAVAVANAAPEIKRVADVVLPEENGAGIRSLIKDLINGKIPISLERDSHLMSLGKTLEGKDIFLNPLSLLTRNLVIAGSSGSGKSWLAGLIVEKLLRREYQICIIDPEGDYGGIRAFPQTLLLGGNDSSPPPVEQVITLIEYTSLSLILDLSQYTLSEKNTYLTSLLQGLRSLRCKRGKPHWLLIDEAHYFCPFEGSPLTDLILREMEEGGVGIISYRPSFLAPAVLKAVNHWMLTQIKDELEFSFLKDLMCLPDLDLPFSQVAKLEPGKALMCFNDPVQNAPPHPVIIEYQAFQRITPHVRHLRKYLRAPLPASKRFYFNISEPYKGPIAAASLWEFLEALAMVPLSSLQYHLENKHFEQWLTKVLHDEDLARQIRKIARRNLKGELLREQLISITKKRYDELERLI